MDELCPCGRATPKIVRRKRRNGRCYICQLETDPNVIEAGALNPSVTTLEIEALRARRAVVFNAVLERRRRCDA